MCDEDSNPEPGAVDVTMTFSVPASMGGQDSTYEPENRNQAPTVWFQDHMVRIHDGRNANRKFGIDRSGFGFEKLETRVWHDAESKSRKYEYASELRQLLARVSQARELFVLSVVRRGEGRKPLLFAHNDFNFMHGPVRANEAMGERAGELSYRRFAIVQTWQPVLNEIVRHPLAFCDAATVRECELIPERGTFMLAHYPDQRWYYLPHMQPDEVAIFKTYDSSEDGRARFAPHASFNHPDTPLAAPERQSVESRWLLVW